MRSTNIIAIFFFLVSVLFGQNKTYIGVESAVTNDFYDIVEYGNKLKEIPLIGARLGLNIRHDFNDFVAIETGLLSKRVREGFAFETIPGGGSGTAVRFWSIPLKLYTKINIHKNKVFLSPVIGVSFCYSPDNYGSGEMNGQYKSNTDSVTFYSYSYYGNVGGFILLQSGLSLDFVYKNGSFFSVFANYMAGTTKIFETNITYRYNNEAWANGGAFSKGSYCEIGISYKYPISKLWQKKKTE